jgi:four helix bundle protein
LKAGRQKAKVDGEGKWQELLGRVLLVWELLRSWLGRHAKTLDFSSGTTPASSRTTMNQWREDMKKRTHAFAVDIIRFVQDIPDRSDTRRLKDQLVGAASGADLNWHAACRGRTHKEFTAKLGVVLEEADEAAECLVVIRDSRIATGDELARLCQEGHELRLIFARAARTANENEEKEKRMSKAGRQKVGRQKRRAET